MPRRSSDVWQYFQTISEENNKKRVVCIYCNVEYKNALATRLRLHINKCSKCPEAVKTKFLDNEKEISKITHSTPSTSSGNENIPTIQSQVMSACTPLSTESSFTSRNSDYLDCSATSSGDIDAALARAIYASGVPLSVFESSYWKEVFRLLNPNYKLPSRYVISNSLLDAEYERVKEDSNKKINNSVSLGLVVDGWSNILGKGVINFIVTTPQPIFYKAVYPEERETSEYLFEQIAKVISEIGEKRFVIVITDNASNMKAAWRLLVARFPHISCVGCVSHSLNLIFNDILKIATFDEIIKRVRDVIKYIKHTHLATTYFEKYQNEKYGRIKYTLKLPSKTRWSGAVFMLDSYMQNREALEALAICREFSVKRDVKYVILNETIWMQIDESLKILRPISNKILKSESDKCILSEIPPMFQSLQNEVASELQANTTISMNDKRLLLDSIAKRRVFCLKPIHYASNMLDPRYRGNELSDEEVIMATDFIRQWADYLKKDLGAVLKNMCDFRNKMGHFGISDTIWIAANTVEPNIWWNTFANGQILCPIATRILSTPSSSAASERNWSTFGRIHSKLRNRLNKERVCKLVSIQTNLSLRDDVTGCTGKSDESDDDSEISESGLLSVIARCSNDEWEITEQENTDMQVEDPLGDITNRNQ